MFKSNRDQAVLKMALDMFQSIRDQAVLKMAPIQRLVIIILKYSTKNGLAKKKQENLRACRQRKEIEVKTLKYEQGSILYYWIKNV